MAEEVYSGVMETDYMFTLNGFGITLKKVLRSWLYQLGWYRVRLT